jgi:hypothetical protein
VNFSAVRAADSRRVYTILSVLMALLLGAGISVADSQAPAPLRLTLEPTMMKGPAGAPVTIIEFSDYQ